MKTDISLEEALGEILGAAVPLGVERVAPEDAPGRFLAREVIARRDSPPHGSFGFRASVFATTAPRTPPRFFS